VSKMTPVFTAVNTAREHG